MKTFEITLERTMSSIAEVLAFVYGDSYMFDPSKFPTNDGILLDTLGGQEVLLYGDTVVKDTNGSIFIQWSTVFNELYEEVTNG